jgi:hypothetical protein
MKIQRAFLENKIIKMIQTSNDNTPHFEYKVNFEEGTITLDVFTFNPNQNALHFLHEVTEQTPILCLTQMVIYLEKHGNLKKEKIPFTIKWQRKGTGEYFNSYYFEESEDVAIEKFLHGKNPNDYTIEVKQNPIS